MILSSIVQLKDLISKLEDKKMPIQLSYKIMKLNKEIESDIKFYQETFKQIITEYGETDETGNLIFLDNGNIKIKEGVQQECILKLTSLENTEVNTPSIKFKLEELSVIELTPNEAQSIEAIIQE